MLVTVIVLFFIHTAINLQMAWIAIIGAMTHLVVADVKKIEEILEKIELGTLMFFAALFVLMQSLAELGLIDWIGDRVSDMIESVPEGTFD